MSTNKVLKFEDKLGFFMGTIIFFVSLPMTLVLSYLPKLMIDQYISNPVVSAATGFVFLGLGALMNLVWTMLFGLMASYGLCWAARRVHLVEWVRSIGKKDQNPIEMAHYTTWGALLGGIVAAALFVTSGHTPLEVVTLRVEHLFPAPIVMNVGTTSVLDLSHAYAVATGFLTVGFLFAIGGLALGTVTAAVLERFLVRSTH